MQMLMNNLAKEFMITHPGISIRVDGGGTASGVKALIEGSIDICSASRLLKAEEISRTAEKYRSVGVYSIIAKDALSVYVHPANPVKNLTLKQLKQIFTGEMINWSEAGGADADIHVLIRPPNSGTNSYFREHVLENEPYSPRAIILPTTQQIVAKIMRDTLAIGYGGIAFGPAEIHSQVNGINPSVDNVRYDLYPISRYLYLYTVQKPRGLVREFIDWTVSLDGQRIIHQTGFISLWAIQ
jgi:phosphate transport system substrate-binding protein